MNRIKTLAINGAVYLYQVNIIACSLVGTGLGIFEGMEDKNRIRGALTEGVMGTLTGSVIGIFMPAVISFKICEYFVIKQ